MRQANKIIIMEDDAIPPVPPVPVITTVLFDDTFSSGGVGSPRTATHGPGFSQIVDTNAIMSVAGDALVMNGMPAVNNGLIVSNGAGTPITFGHSAGRVSGIETFDRNTVAINFRLGIWSAAGLTGSDGMIDYGGAGGAVRIKVGVVPVFGIVALGGATQRFIAIMRPTGYLLVGQADSDESRLLWVYPANVAANVFTKIWVSSATNAKVGRWFVADTTLGEADWLFASQSTVVDGAITHPANMHLLLTVGALPPTNPLRINFRRVDADTYWQVSVAADATVSLREFNLANPSGVVRGSAAGTAGAHLLRIYTRASTITVYQGETQRISYSSATVGQTATDGDITMNGATVSNLQIWHETATAGMQAKWNEVWA